MNAQTEESESINQSMEKIADAAAPAPNIRMIYDHTAALKARSDIPAEYDKRFPKRKHVWQSSRIGHDVLKRGGYDVILEDGGPVYSGDDILCAVPKDVYDGIRKREQEQSEASIARYVPEGKRHEFRRKRNPKAPLGEEDK